MSSSSNQLPKDSNSELDKIALELINARADLDDVEIDIETTEDDISPYEEEIRAMEQTLREKRQKLYESKNKIGELKVKRSNITSRVRELEGKMHKLKQEAFKRDEWEKRSSELDEFATMYPWFSAIKTHQFEAAKQIAVLGGRVILGDKRGLGKSLTAIASADLLKSKKIVVISKGEILRNFESEIKKWTDNKRMVLSIVSAKKTYRDMVIDTVLPMAEEWYILVNFEAWWRDKGLVQRIAKLQPDTVVVDEAHHAKETDKNNFRGLQTLIYNKNKCPNCGHNEAELYQAREWTCKKCAHVDIDNNFMSVKHVIPMTGSPIMNKPEEFFALGYMIDRVNFPSKDAFLHRYCELRDYTNLMGKTATRWEFRYGGSEKLLNSIGPQFIQRDRKSAGVDIPDQEIQHHYLEFDRAKYPRQWKAYQDLITYMGALFDSNDKGYIVATQASSLITRMRQIASWPMGIKIHETDQEGFKKLVWQCDVNESIKVDKAVELASELVGEGERVVIFSKFTAVLDELKRRFDSTRNTDEQVRAAIYYGATPNHERDRIKHDFDISTYDSENYEYDVVLCQYQSAGEGLNFNSATQMIFIEREWNPEKEGQATGRIQRLGQTQKTTVHVLELEDTIDTQITRILGDKKDMVDQFEGNAEMVRKILEEARRNS